MLTGLLTAKSIQAQAFSQWAIGFRIGDKDGFGAELSTQYALPDSTGTANNRIEIDVAFSNRIDTDKFKSVVQYHWLFPLSERFNAFLGGGASIGIYECITCRGGGNKWFGTLATSAGLEYRFIIPLQVSLDFRPEKGLFDYQDDIEVDLALGLRYLF